MLVKNLTQNESMLFNHILRTEQPKEFIQAIIDREYDGTENWSISDEYEFEETPYEV